MSASNQPRFCGAFSFHSEYWRIAITDRQQFMLSALLHILSYLETKEVIEAIEQVALALIDASR